MGEWDAPPPDKLGRYTLLGKLARGGMAELFLAKSEGIEGFEKIVVLKRILPSFAEDDEFIDLFLSEARLAAQLDHANIVHVHDIGREGANFFFTMEYLHGHDVRRLLNEARRRGVALPLQFVLSIVAGAAAGLHYAHEQVDFSGRPLDIVHRDVSPSNIIVTYSGHVKVLDFGIAKAVALSQASRSSSLKGKVAYMSPEQCKGGHIDRRSDIFALGLVMQEMLTSHPVFGELGHVEALHAVAAGKVPPIGELWPECPADLAAIVGRALQPDPDERYATARELQRDLERFAHDHRLMLSSTDLAEFLEDVFGTKRFPWLDAETAVEQGAPPTTASATVDKRGEMGLSGGTRVATMLAPEPTQVADTPRTEVGAGSETGISVQAPIPTPERRRLWPWAAGIVAVLGALGVAWFNRLPAAKSTAVPVSAPAASTAEPEPQPEPEPEPEVEPAPRDVDPPPEPAVVEAPPSEPEPEPEPELEPAPTPAPKPRSEPKPRKPKPRKQKPEPKPEPKQAKPAATEPKAKSDPNAMLPF